MPAPSLSFLPVGRRLSDDAWRARHRSLTLLLWAHVPALAAFGLLRGHPLAHVALTLTPTIAVATLALLRIQRGIRSCATALGLVMTASVLVHLSGGVIEAHFHYFVIIAFLSLYQSWPPFLVALGYVVAEHGLVGVLAPASVFNHADAVEHPWRWAAIHGGGVLFASLANLLSWRLTEREATRDALTGLPNRAFFLDATEAALRRRSCCVGLVVVDLDNFKDANDAFGHQVGDAALRQIAARLAGVIGPRDVLARLGGDEFAVLVPDAGTDAVAALARAVTAATRQPVTVGTLQLTLGSSAGYAVTADRLAAAEDLLRDADLAMYEAKRGPGEHVAAFRAELRDDAVRRIEVEAELRAALGTGQLVVWFQPIVELPTGRVVAAEALIRWQHPTRGLLPPGAFIEVAERSGLIADLGTEVLGAACRQAAAWAADGLGMAGRGIQVAVNLSPRQLTDPHLLQTVSATLVDAGLPATALVLEITEDSLIRDFAEVLPVLEALRADGVTLALDDFGTGYSSLSYLRQLPVSTVKIDRSFVTGLAAGSTNVEIIKAVTHLAHVLGMSVVAEGIETQAEGDALVALGVDRAQGYSYGRPQPAEGLTAMLRAQRAQGNLPAQRDQVTSRRRTSSTVSSGTTTA